MDTVDCLDCENSELSRNASSGRVNRIYRYALKHEMLAGKRIFKLPRESGGELIVDDDFRRAVQTNNLKGLLFEEIPLANGKKQEKKLTTARPQFVEPPKRKRKKERALTGHEKLAVAEQVDNAMKELDIPHSATPDTIQQKIYQEISRVQREPATFDRSILDNIALGLGCLWGQSICQRLNWHWASITLDEFEGIGIVSPSRSLVAFPMGYINGLVSDPRRDQTSLLLYNMLKEGHYSEVEGSYTVIG